MECNKEEAIRAKDIAEKKMQDRDFVGAKKIALKAQQLYSDLENISQILTVCDVHCSAEHKVLGTEMNWYRILQVEQTADEISIKKQFRKLALLLHPDKNKFSGAEAAFKLIGEAQRVLSDQSSRSIFDMKYKASMNTAVQRQPQQPRNRNSNAKTQPGMSNGNTNIGGYQQQQQPTQQAVFWTVCPHCNIRYQYYKDVLNRALRCQSCNQTFIAYDLNVQGIPQAANWSNISVPKHAVPNQKNFASNVGFQGPPSHGTKVSETSQKHPSRGTKASIPSQKPGDTGKGPKPKAEEDGNVGKEGSEKPKFKVEKVKLNRKGNKSEEPSETCDTESSTDSDEYENLYAKAGISRDDNPNARRSSRRKQQVSYNEDQSDDDLTRPPKRSKGSKSSATEGTSGAPLQGKTSETIDCDEDKEARKGNSGTPREQNLPNGNGKAEELRTDGNEAEAMEDDMGSAKVSNETKPDPEFFEVPDPDFYDFDKDRKEDCFAINQMWAIYDDIDGMPRFYARIKKVSSPGFRVQITWLEADPEEDDEIEWYNEGLPISCGIFKHGKTETTEDLGMFSHVVAWEKGRRRGTYNMQPRKGDVWALFKKWDMKWSSDPDSHKPYEFEFVEVISDYAEGSGSIVAYLVKVKGFVSLFRLNAEIAQVHIPPNELFRFSHRVPAYRTTGQERENVPEGYFELDPASLSENLEEVDMEVDSNGSKMNSSCSKTPVTETDVPKTSIDPSEKKSQDPVNSGSRSKSPSEPSRGSEKHSDGAGTKHNNVSEDSAASSMPSTPEPFAIPDAEFYCFDLDRTQTKFAPGQIWALFCEVDGLPKYHALITKVESGPNFTLHLTWVEPCSLPDDMIQWSDKDIPVCCGRFGLGDSQVFTDTSTFSHQSSAKVVGDNKYEIYPRKGEVWAMYKNFNPEWKHTDLADCTYEMAEVLDANDVMTKVLPLELVDDCKTIFKAKTVGETPLVSEISRVDLLRFSHRVPSFRITEEVGVNRKGFWELDPKSMPTCFFR